MTPQMTNQTDVVVVVVFQRMHYGPNVPELTTLYICPSSYFCAHQCVLQQFTLARSLYLY